MDPVCETQYQQFVKLTDALKEHNHNNTSIANAFKLAAQRMLDFFEQRPPSGEYPSESKFACCAEQIFKEHAGLLNKIGLELVRNRGRAEARAMLKEAAKEQQTQVAPSDRLYLELIDGGRLARFLHSFPVRDDAGPALRFLAESLDDQLETGYIMKLRGAQDEGWEEFTDSLDDVAEELTRLNQKESAAVLGAHLDGARRGDLFEYLLAEEKNLFSLTGWSPATWHHDCDPGRYQELWDDAFDVLGRCMRNSNARQLAERVRDSLLKGAEKAEAEIRAQGGPTLFLQILERVKRRLEG